MPAFPWRHIGSCYAWSIPPIISADSCRGGKGFLYPSFAWRVGDPEELRFFFFAYVIFFFSFFWGGEGGLVLTLCARSRSRLAANRGEVDSRLYALTCLLALTRPLACPVVQTPLVVASERKNRYISPTQGEYIYMLTLV